MQKLLVELAAFGRPLLGIAVLCAGLTASVVAMVKAWTGDDSALVWLAVTWLISWLDDRVGQHSRDL